MTRHVGIIGLGLIGGSIGSGLRAGGWRVSGYDADGSNSAIASDLGITDTIVDSLDDLLAAAPDMLVVAVPPKATVETLAGLRWVGPVMDVAGVKTPILEAAEHLPGFVGTHPMAGRETAGPVAASAALFRGASWVVVDGGPPDAGRLVEDLIVALGALPIHMTAEAHDAAVARISHMPQLLAGALLAAASDTDGALDLAAGSFRDLTRVGASQPIPWVELLRANADEVLDALGALKNHLSRLEAAMLTSDDGLLTMLSAARETRASLGAPAAAVRVALADRPGEIAKVGHALENSQVDVRDIQLRHAPHGGGGVLTLSVRPGDEAPLEHALADQGLLLVP